MSEEKIYPVPAQLAESAVIDAASYEAMYQRSVDDPEGFWAEKAEQFVSWNRKWDTVLDWSYGEDNLHIEWFKGATLNVAVNCVDRHLETRGDQTAIIWEGDDPNDTSPSPIANCTNPFAASATQCARAALARATVSVFTCR